MRRLTLAAVALAVAIGLALLLAEPRGADRSDSARPSAGEPVADDGRAEPAPVTLTEADAVATPARTAAAPDEFAVGAVAADAPEGPTTVRGRLVFEDGGPASGVAVELRGSRANSERVAEFGLPKDWRNRETETDADGRFAFRLDPPRAFQFFVAAHAPGYAPVRWRWGELPVGVDRDLGTVQLLRGGDLEVHLEQPDGSTAGTDWRVHADDGVRDSFGVRGGTGRDSARRDGVLDPTRGVWRITDLPPGKVEVAAYSKIANWIELDGVEVVAGETRACTLVYDGPDNDRRIVVRVFTGPIYPVRPEATSVMLTGGPLVEPLRCTREFGAQSHDFPDLADGLYTVVVDDPSFERFEQHGVRPGDRVDARVRGNAAVRVTVVDADSGAAIPEWSLNIRCEGVRFSPAEFPLVAKGDAPPADGRFDSLVPLDYSLVALAPGYPPMRRSVPALAAGEERAVRFELSRRGAVAGRVIDGAGDPVEGLAVELYPGSVLEERIDWWTMWGQAERDGARLGVATTGADGAFRIATSEGGRLALRVVAGSALHALHAIDHVAGTAQGDVELTVPVGVRVVGRVLAPPGASFDGLTVRAGVANETPNMDPGMWDASIDAILECAVGADGGFELGPFGSGGLQFALIGATGGVLLEQHEQPAGAGDFAVELDLVERWPGTVVIEASSAGVALDRGSVALEEQLPDGRWWRRAGGRLDRDGRATMSVPAGRYRVRVDSAEKGAWTWWTADSRTVEPLGELTWTLDAPVHGGSLRLVDATDGGPLAGVAVQVLRLDPDGRVHRSGRTTRPDGSLELTLVPGDVWLRRKPDGPAFAVRPEELDGLPQILWTPAGPTETVVALP